MRRVRQFLVSAAVAVSAFSALPAVAAAAPCQGADGGATSATASAQATLCLLNGERRARGLRPLKLDVKLSRAAVGHSRDMVAQHYFAHESRNGGDFSDRIKRTGWTRSRRSYTMGENIAWGGGSLSTPRAIVRGWMHSAGHKANILARDFRFIGVGIADGAPSGGTGATYTTTFGG